MTAVQAIKQYNCGCHKECRQPVAAFPETTRYSATYLASDAKAMGKERTFELGPFGSECYDAQGNARAGSLLRHYFAPHHHLGKF